MPQQEKPQPAAARDDELPYAVELWGENRSAVEKVLARAFSVSLARAIFRAATEENPGRHITLRHGERVLEDNDG